MCSPSRQIIVILICVLISALALTWIVRGLYFAPQSPSSSTVNISPSKCEEWDRAEASSQGIGWDLAYESILKRNGFSSDSPLWKWIHTDGRRPPVNELVARWQGEPIISSILIETATAEGSPGGFWFIRTANHLYRWGFYKGVFGHQKEELTTLQEYDKAFESMACWQQGVPVRTDTVFEGYVGFLSLYKDGKSCQMLLTFRDLCLADPEIVNREGEKITRDENNWGRLWKTLKPVSSTLP